MTTLSTTWHHIRRSPFQSFGALFVMILSFFVLSSFLILSSGLSQVLGYFENKPAITIFLKDGLDKATVVNVQKELASFPKIKEIKFISKEDALTIYKEQNKDNPLLLEMVTANILPASFEISAYDPAVLQRIATNFTNRSEIVDEIVYQKDIISTLLVWTNIARKVGLAFILVLGTVSFLFIFTVITMKITNRKEEIVISRLLGATGWYISRPFLLEGVFYGVFGCLLGTCFSVLIFWITKDRLNYFFSPVTFFSVNVLFFGKILAEELAVGVTLGLVASFLGVKKHIRF